MADNINDALDKLRENKLVVKQRPGSRPEILGGSACSTSLGIDVYSNAFSITREDDAWIARVSGGGQQINEFAATSLWDAVVFIIDHYKKAT